MRQRTFVETHASEFAICVQLNADCRTKPQHMDRRDSCLGIEMAEKLDWNSRLGPEIFSIESFRLVSVSPSLVSSRNLREKQSF